MIIKLLPEHHNVVKELIDNATLKSINSLSYMMFNGIYLADLNNFHAYGYFTDDKLKAVISFYESDEDPAWYYTSYLGLTENDINILLDSVILHNENNKRLKFYTLNFRNSVWDKYQNERYSYVNELLVPRLSRCNFTNHWEVLFNRSLLDTDITIRCYYLKQEHRTI
jgi:hypothetical protein